MKWVYSLVWINRELERKKTFFKHDYITFQTENYSDDGNYSVSILSWYEAIYFKLLQSALPQIARYHKYGSKLWFQECESMSI